MYILSKCSMANFRIIGLGTQIDDVYCHSFYYSDTESNRV